MITDKIEHISIYRNIPSEAIDFIKKLSSDISMGRYEISENIYANIEQYTTKNTSDCRYESHKKYADIQILLTGEEDIYYTDAKSLNISEPYNQDKDITFYSDKIKKAKINLDGTNFVMLYPHEAHAPQACTNNHKNVLKVVVKVKLNP